MKASKYKRTAAAVAVVAGLLPAASMQGQTSEALMEALVRKGILTEQEAEDIKADLAKENRSFIKVRAAGRETASLNIYGDVRGRFEGFYADHPDFLDRNRFRYRLRVGMTATLYDRFEAGFRLTSGEAVGTTGGDPISGNTTFQDNGSKKFAYIDLAYGKWTAISNLSYQASLTMGKMENPFVFSDMVFDGDYTPEGIASQMTYHLNLNQTLKFNLAGFALDELGAQSDDPYMVGAQFRYDAVWQYNDAYAPKLQSSVGLGVLALLSEDNLGNAGVPNVNVGNTRDGAGNLAANFSPIIADASLTYTLDRFPFFNGPFPIRLAGEYMNNPEESRDHQAYAVGVTFGKSGRKGAWDLAYRWKYLESNAWYEEVVDSDFGAFYGAAWPGAGANTTPGYRAGTNVKGHIVKASYSPFAAFTLGVTWFHTSLIDPPAGNGDSDMNRLQVDAVWKF